MVNKMILKNLRPKSNSNDTIRGISLNASVVAIQGKSRKKFAVMLDPKDVVYVGLGSDVIMICQSSMYGMYNNSRRPEKS